MFDDMVLAYNNGAKYILAFDYPNLADGLLKEEHFEALSNFWTYAQNHLRETLDPKDRVAYVLPPGYAYGFRGEDDRIWVLWEADKKSSEIYNLAISLANEYSARLDIVYEDVLQLNASIYGKFIFWNGTSLCR